VSNKHAVKVIVGVEIEIETVLISSLDGGEK
jgi:hypothetical protein